jgi:ketosteroid isomerase-like protein
MGAETSKVEELRKAFAAFEAGDPSVFRDLYDDEVELYIPPTQFEGAGLMRGKDAVIEWFRENQLAAWSEYRYSDLRFEELGPHVIARYGANLTARRSGIEVGSEFVTIFTFREAKVVALAHYSESR